MVMTSLETLKTSFALDIKLFEESVSRDIGTEGTLKKIEAAGGQVLTPRTDIAPGAGAFAVFADPAGAEFGLYEEPKR